MRSLLALLLLPVTVACGAPSGSARPAPTASPQLAIQAVPGEVGDFRLTETQRYPDPSAGSMYRYRNGSLHRPDVFVYPLSETARAGGSDPLDRARAESGEFKQALPILRDRGRYEAFEIVGEHPIRLALPAGTIHGWHVHTVLRRGQEELDSHQHVLVIGDQLVKVRTTYRRGAVAPEALASFLEQLTVALLER